MQKTKLGGRFLNFCTKSKIGLAVLKLLGYRVKGTPEVIVLVGGPGSGKSTYACRLERKGYVRINQDELGSRGACKRVMQEALKKGQSVVIDRCNFDVWQRSTWINVSKNYNVKAVKCVIFNVPIAECIRRVKSRSGHPTIDPKRHNVAEIITMMYNKYVIPSLDEGFTEIVNYEVNTWIT